MPSKLSLALIASLAVNAALVGVIAGQVLNKRQPVPEPQFARYGPTSDVVAAAWAQLPDEDRTSLRKELRDRWVALEGDRKQLTEAGKAVHDAALAEPFNESRLRDAVVIFQTREQRMQQSAEDILIRHLGKMPPEARATAAVGLLTPFNARMQRSGDGRAPKPPGDGKMRGGKPGGDAQPAPGATSTGGASTPSATQPRPPN
jgi:uncharacterized membrane protein